MSDERETSPSSVPASKGAAPTSRARRMVGRLALGGLCAAVFYMGWLYRGGGSDSAHREHGQGLASAAKEGGTIYTCSMHPQIRQPKPGKCPLCGMDLISVDTAGGAEPRELVLSPRARALAEIEVARVERRMVSRELRVVGKVAWDERRTHYLTSWIEGRIDRLYVTYVGERVRRWQPLALIYSPELVSAQAELLQAIRLVKALGQEDALGRRTTAATLTAAREKLRLLNLSNKEIAEVEARGKPMDRVTIFAPVAGVVVERRAREQMYVRPGERLFTVSDITHLWVVLDVYEPDLGAVRVGQPVSFTVEAYPGESFTAKVAFVDPVVDDRTRTIKVRLDVSNADLHLKPEMLVRAVLQAPAHSGGPAVASTEPSLVMPASAALLTGKRAVVYVETAPGTYVGREVVLGPRAGDYYVIREGLKEGDRVVVNGAFKIDSALQIQAKPSMMSPPAGGAPDVTARLAAPRAFREGLDLLTEAYFAVHHALSRDQLVPSQAAALRLADSLAKVPMDGLSGPAAALWNEVRSGLAAHADAIAKAPEIKQARTAFDGLSQAIIKAVRHYGLTGRVPAIVYHCPMAFGNKGADWLQATKGTENPYYGAEMFACGDEKETLTEGAKPAAPRAPQPREKR